MRAPQKRRIFLTRRPRCARTEFSVKIRGACGMRPLEQPQPVDGFGPGFFRVAGAVTRGPMLLTLDAVQPWGGMDDTAPLLALAGRADVLVLGTGAGLIMPAAALTKALAAAGIGLEPMATEAALRTFNLLLGDGRRIALAALPV